MRFESGGIGCNGEADRLGRPTKGQKEIFAPQKKTVRI